MIVSHARKNKKQSLTDTSKKIVLSLGFDPTRAFRKNAHVWPDL